MKNNPKYLLLSDIINSSSLDDLDMYNAINFIECQINQEFSLSVPLFITLGDSCQMVCKDYDQMSKVVKRMDDLGNEHNIKFRYVAIPYLEKTNHINTIEKFVSYGSKSGGAFINPLINTTFIKANKMIDKRNNCLIVMN